MKTPSVPRCRACGCTDADCSRCIDRTGQPCRWVAPDLCSACAGQGFSVVVRLHAGLTNVATVRLGAGSFRASATSSQDCAARRLAAKVAAALGATDHFIGCVRRISIDSGHAILRLTFTPNKTGDHTP